MRIFDIHPHVVSADTKRYPLNHLFDHVADYVHARPVDTDAMVRAMDEAGVAKAVLVHSSMAYGYDCNYAADSAAAHPDRFASVCAVNVRAPDAVQMLRHWVRERGMNGMRIFTSGGAMPKDPNWVIDPLLFPVFEEAEELGIPICFRNPPASFGLLPQLINEFPTVPIITEYIYGPAEGEKAPFPSCDAFWALSDEPSFYLKLKTHNILELSPDPAVRQAFLARLVEVFGADRIAYGSNYPTSEGTLVEIVEDAKRELAFLPERDREAIFSNTALTLYPALGTRAGSAA